MLLAAETESQRETKMDMHMKEKKKTGAGLIKGPHEYIFKSVVIDVPLKQKQSGNLTILLIEVTHVSGEVKREVELQYFNNWLGKLLVN